MQNQPQPEPKITVFVMSYNEARQIRQVMETIKWADEIVLLDSFSTDGTVEIAREYGAKIVSEKFCGFGRLRNLALAASSNDWMVSIDSDERCTPEFAAEVREIVRNPRHDAYFVPRLNFFLDRPMRYCGMYPDYRQPQLFDRRKFRYREDLVHEGFVCEGTTGYCANPITQLPFPTLAVMMAKNERYTTLMAKRRFDDHRRAGLATLLFSPMAAFLKKYFIQQGFREGIYGFVFSALHAYYTFLKYAKLWELGRQETALKTKTPA
jgi:glycosyltransferase involved in cell wall biosynthesis